MAELILIRHGKTAGNLLGRYIGSRTDEPLCDEGREGLAGKQMPEVERLYVSPMKRCVETAEILWPGFDRKKMQKVTDLRECMISETLKIRIIKNCPEMGTISVDRQQWHAPFPNGESMDAFKSRCLEAFARIVEEVSGAEQEWIASGKTGIFRAGIVVHGGTIMAILEQYGYPKAAYFDYQVKNGCGYRLTPVEGTRLWNCLCLQ